MQCLPFYIPCNEEVKSPFRKEIGSLKLHKRLSLGNDIAVHTKYDLNVILLTGMKIRYEITLMAIDRIETAKFVLNVADINY